MSTDALVNVTSEFLDSFEMFGNTSAAASAFSTNATEEERLRALVTRIREGVLVELIVYAVCFIIGALSNLWVFHKLSRKVNKTRMNHMLRHLTFADLMVVFFAIFPEIIWRISITWEVGLVMCKLLNTVKAFTLYLSSNIIVCISLDRYYAFVEPLSRVDPRDRNKAFLIASYLIAAFISVPQAFIFHIKTHPEIPSFKQCTPSGYIETAWIETAYNIGSVFAMYFIPLLFIIFCYTMILIKISGNFDVQAPSETATNDTRTSNMERALRNTLKMTVSIVVTFIFCWTPYAVMVIWFQVDIMSAREVPQWLVSTFFIFAYSSSVVNPFLHSRHLLNCFSVPQRSPINRNHSIRTTTMVTQV